MAKITYGDGAQSATSGGLNFAGALALLFIGLKLTGFISWSWLWVLSPIWMPFAVVIVLAAVVGTGALIMKWADK
jgi:hypothetical protein